MRPQDPFEAMLHRHRGLLFSLCRHYSRRGVEVDDLLQEVTVALWRDSERLLSLSAVPQTALIWNMKPSAACWNNVRQMMEEAKDGEEA